MPKRIEVWTQDDEQELDLEGSPGHCEVQVVCYGADVGVTLYEHPDGGEEFTFRNYVVLGGDDVERPVVICEDCDGWLAEIYERRDDA